MIVQLNKTETALSYRLSRTNDLKKKKKKNYFSTYNMDDRLETIAGRIHSIILRMVTITIPLNDDQSSISLY